MMTTRTKTMMSRAGDIYTCQLRSKCVCACDHLHNICPFKHRTLANISASEAFGDGSIDLVPKRFDSFDLRNR